MSGHAFINLYRYHNFSLPFPETFNSSFNSCFAASCIANVHLNSLDNIHWTLIFWKTFLYIIFTVTSSFNRNGPYSDAKKYNYLI